tara:strand:+ start:1168 stop:2931 length:1764 start_codon:yes stop_codon:yes gene_type:complete
MALDVDWGIVPLDSNSSRLAVMSWPFRGSDKLESANGQLRYQIESFGKSEAQEPTSGDLVNVVFKIYTSIDSNTWNQIATITKSRDIANRSYRTGLAAPGHRFTIDISQLASDQLSYSLCPINKGTWQSNSYGGMNGGLTMQDNVIFNSPISDYNVSQNGTFRMLRVEASFEELDDNDQIVVSTHPTLRARDIAVINSVNQFEKDSTYYSNTYNIQDSNTVASSVPHYYNFLTRCPNFTGFSYVADFRKPVRIDEQAEWLQFFINQSSSTDINTDSTDAVCAMGIEIITYVGDTIENTFYLNDFQDNLITDTDTITNFNILAKYQNQTSVQNISPYYINNTTTLKAPQSPIDRTGSVASNWNNYTGDRITDSTTRYTAQLVKVGLSSPYTFRDTTYTYQYTIDRENENIPYGYVRFHWLNSLGGIDSYTAKRDVVEGLTISRDVIERKSSDRTWYQANRGAVNGNAVYVDDSAYISDTMRGGDIYKGGREVSRVNADRVLSVYTEPLNKSTANWLEEMMLSVNVWIEMDTLATNEGNLANPYLRPSTKGYIPVIITNSEIESVNQAEGLVKFNIEYTLSHKVQTQRN